MGAGAEMRAKKLKYRAVWAIGTMVITSGATTYSIAHKLLTAASQRGRTGWVEEVKHTVPVMLFDRVSEMTDALRADNRDETEGSCYMDER